MTTQSRGTDDLRGLPFYLISRFVVVLLVVVATEHGVALFEEHAFVPLLERMATRAGTAGAYTTTSAASTLAWIATLMGFLAKANYLSAAGIALQSAFVGIVLLMLVVLALPVAAGAAVFSFLVARRVRAIQEEREREVQELEQRRNRFMTDIAHDLRTPLMAIGGMAHALDDGLVRDKQTHGEYVRAICSKTDKMSELVSTVFDYAKLGSGDFALEREDVDLSQLLLREAALAYTDMEAVGMEFDVRVDEKPCVVHADPVQLARVVSNLLANAARHNEAGTVVLLELDRKAGVACVVVADTGRPLLGDPQKLFEPFAREDGSRSAEGSSGLGLSICKEIAQMHGYDLFVAQPYGSFCKAFVLKCAVV